MGDGHTSSDCTSFSSVFRVLKNEKIRTELFGFGECDLGCLIFGAIIGDNDFVVGVDFFEVFNCVFEHDGEPGFLVVAGYNKGKVDFFLILTEVILT